MDHVDTNTQTPIDYAEASKRYANEAKDPALTPIEQQAKQDIADYTAQRALEIGQALDNHDTIPSLIARTAMKQALSNEETKVEAS
jgi:hypothetical protein